MMKSKSPAEIHVIAPNFKRRLSGVTATIVRLVPLQAKTIAIAAAGPVLPDHVPQIRLRDLLFMSSKGPRGPRVWHARRNVEMLAGLFLRNVLRKRLRLVFTSASQRVHTGYSKWLISKMDAVIATSSKTASFLERDATVIRHGIDLDSFHPAPDRAALKKELGFGPGPLIGCYGRIRHQKGTDAFVDAMLRVLPEFPEAQAVVMGRATGKHEAFLKDLRDKIAKAGLEARIQFRPEVPVEQMARWYQVLDLFVAPQRSEGFGLTPLEAMACAVPVVATRVGAFEELIVEGETGHLVEPGAPEAIAVKVADLLHEPARLEKFSEAARPHVERNFRIEDEAAAINRVYENVSSSES